MNNDREAQDGNKGEEIQPKHDDGVARLMNLAGLRPVVSAEIEARVYDRVLDEWHNSLPTSRSRKWVVPLALAASILLAVTFIVRPALIDGPVVGTIARVNNEFSAPATSFKTGDEVRVNQSLQTGRGQLLNIMLSDGTSLRLAANTSLRLDEPHNFSLHTGKIYADSGRNDFGSGGLEIHTELGVITDVGTQFMVSLQDAALRVAVRQGRVDVAADREIYTALAGDSLMMVADGGMTRDQIAATDSEWDWTLQVASRFDIENRTLLDFLTWVARETGKNLVFTTDESRVAARNTILHGSISDFTPAQAATTVLATTVFHYDVSATTISVSQ
jgi:FecR protein